MVNEFALFRSNFNFQSMKTVLIPVSLMTVSQTRRSYSVGRAMVVTEELASCKEVPLNILRYYITVSLDSQNKTAKSLTNLPSWG
jgi:hypothetical protein